MSPRKVDSYSIWERLSKGYFLFFKAKELVFWKKPFFGSALQDFMQAYCHLFITRNYGSRAYLVYFFFQAKSSQRRAESNLIGMDIPATRMKTIIYR